MTSKVPLIKHVKESRFLDIQVNVCFWVHDCIVGCISYLPLCQKSFWTSFANFSKSFCVGHLHLPNLSCFTWFCAPNELWAHPCIVHIVLHLSMMSKTLISRYVKESRFLDIQLSVCFWLHRNFLNVILSLLVCFGLIWTCVGSSFVMFLV